jgi:hypothetical protein
LYRNGDAESFDRLVAEFLCNLLKKDLLQAVQKCPAAKPPNSQNHRHEVAIIRLKRHEVAIIRFVRGAKRSQS